MANGGNSTVIDTVLTGDSTGFVKSLKSAEGELDKLNKQVETVVNHVTALANIDLNKLATNIQKVTAVQNITNVSTKKGQGAVRGMHGETVVYDTRDTRASKDAHDLERKIIAEKREQLKQEQIKTQKIAKDVQWYEDTQRIRRQNADNQTRSSMAYSEQVTISKMKAPSVIAYNEALAMKHNNLENYYAFKGKHPEWFVSNRFDPKYQMGSGLMKIGNTISGVGVLGQVAGSALNIAGSFLKSPAIGLATALAEATKGVKSFTSEVVKSYSEVQAIKTNLSVVYGSQTQSDAAFSDIAQYAVKSPFGVQQTSELAILLKQSGVYASDLMDTLKMLGDTAGGNMEKMKRIANNYAQIVSIGKASMLDMRQFAYAGIPIFEAVSKELNVSQQQLRKLISDGKVTSDIIEKVFKDLTGINGLFENATQKGAETLKARLQNLQDAKQLATAGLGQLGVSVGSTYGNDSFVYKGLGFAENVYQGISKWADGKNIENSVVNIDNRDRRVNELQMLIQYAKDKGDEEAVKALELELTEYLKLVDPEKDRATLAHAYDRAAKDWEDALKEVGLDKLEEYISKVDSYEEDFNKAFLDLQNRYGLEKYSYQELSIASEQQSAGAKISGDVANVVRIFQSLEKEMINNYNLGMSYRKMKESYNNVDKRKKLAAAERDTYNAQSAFVDDVSKSAGKTGSVSNNISEIKQLVEKSTENQKIELDKQIKRLEGTQSILKEISSKMNKGYIDFSKVSAQQLNEWINKGAVTATKLNTNTDNPKAAAESRKIITEQFNNRYSEVGGMIRNLDISNADATKLFSLWSSLANNTDRKGNTFTDKEFYDNYNSKMKEIVALLNILSKGNENAFNPLRSAIQQIGTQFTSDTDSGVITAEIAKLMSSGSNVALWKRILSQYTGLAATAITGTNSALESYRDDLAIRGTAGGVFSALLQGGANPALVKNMLKTSGVVNNNALDEDKVFQVDWKMTSKSIKEFAMQLSASTDIIQSYNKGLQDQYDTYVGLLSAGIIQGETAGNVSRTISKKQLEKSLQSYGDQLITAFGEGVTTKDGKKVNWDKEKGFTDEEGNKINEEELVLSGKIFDFLEREIPNIRKELIEGNKRAAENKVLGNLTGTIANTKLMSALLSQSQSSNFARLSDENKQIYLEALKENLKLTDTGYNSVDDLLLAYIKGDDKDAETIINNAIKDLTNASSALNTFTDLLKQVDNSELLNNANSVAAMLMSNSKPTEPYARNTDKAFLYRNLAKPTLDILGMSDVRFSDVAKTMSRNNSDISKLILGVAGGTIKTDALVKELSDIGVDSSYINRIKAANDNYREQIEILKELAQAYGQVTEKEVKKSIADKAIEKSVDNMTDSFESSIKLALEDAWLAPFERLGSDIIKIANSSKSLEQSWKDLGNDWQKVAGQMAQSMGTAMATCGFNIASAAAMSQNWGVVAAGLGLAAMGGVASGLGSALQNGSSDKASEQIERLERLKSDLATLLDQARTDALYYENNLRHKTALGINEQYSYKSVNDAIITPNGNVISTAPDDYLIATKKPQNLVNNTYQPNIIFKVENNAGVNVRQERSIGSDGTVEIVAIIENTVDNYIASSRSDDAFSARQMRLNGKRSVM